MKTPNIILSERERDGPLWSRRPVPRECTGDVAARGSSSPVAVVTGANRCSVAQNLRGMERKSFQHCFLHSNNSKKKRGRGREMPGSSPAVRRSFVCSRPGVFSRLSPWPPATPSPMPTLPAAKMVNAYRLHISLYVCFTAVVFAFARHTHHTDTDPPCDGSNLGRGGLHDLDDWQGCTSATPRGAAYNVALSESAPFQCTCTYNRERERERLPA